MSTQQNKIVVREGLYIFEPWIFGQICRTRHKFPPVGTDLKAMLEAVGCFHTTHYSYPPACQVDCYSSQSSQLGKTVDGFSPPEAYIAPFGTMKTSQQGVSFQDDTSLFSPCPVTKLCGVINNRVLLLNFGRQLRAMTRACIALGVSGTSLTNI